MESQQSPEIAAALALRVERGADAAQIADAIVAMWRDIDVALTPIIGQRAVAALYKRSLFLTAATHTWPASALEGLQASLDLTTLRAVLAQQSSIDAAARGGILLQTFCNLLTSLIGPSLTERLLRSVWANSLSGQPAQDTSS